MAFNGSGTFLRVMNWTSDAQADIDIRSDRHDTQDDDFAAGLSNTLTKDGQSSPVADIPMNGHKITNLGTPTSDKDAVTKLYADTPKPFNSGVEIAGADANGLLKFSSLTGANGLAFTGADLAWLARLATAAGPGTPPVPPATLNRLVLNDKPDGSGADVAIFNDDGSADIGKLNIRTSATIVGNLSANGLVVKPAAAGASALLLADTDGTTARATLSVPSAGGTATLTVGAQPFTFLTNGQFKAPADLFAGTAFVQTNGNVQGSVWRNFAGGAYPDAYSAIANQIEQRASAYANNKVSQTQLQRVGLTYSGNVPGGGGAWTSPGGTVIVGYNRTDGVNGQVYGLYYMTLQIYDDKNGWRNMGG